ncbi:MAG: 16S rRNA (cytidine(1402)-2'-O)-methyltransferase [Candidatus Howiella sp.]|jgi:16S rRNA (cytidine1402-2'-O)-methyltransferase
MGKLYIVGTPIGNLEDFSPRAIRVLSEVDFIAAEDTRVTLKLLNHFGIKKPMVSYFEHNRRERGEEIVRRLLAGECCALVTDAGMPAISDPGEDLVRLCHEEGIPLESVPGPSAVTTALALSGMPSGRFCFEGFLSVNKPSRREHLLSLKEERRTMIFYEAPHKLLATLQDMLEVLGDRPVALVRELTKLHEEAVRTTLSAAAESYAQNPPRGEFVLIVGGAPEEEKPSHTLEEAVAYAAGLRDDGLSAAAAAKEAAALFGFKRGEIYKAIV